MFTKLPLCLRQARVIGQNVFKIKDVYSAATRAYIQHRFSSYQSSKPVGDLSQYTSKFEITKSLEEWKYVERLLPPDVVPDPAQKEEYPSQWKPQGDVSGLPYHVARTKNHMLPVYLKRSDRNGLRRTTHVNRIRGDIWKLHDDLVEHLEKQLNTRMFTTVNEVACRIYFRGDHYNMIKDYLLAKNF